MKEEILMESPWNSLEIVKLFVSIITPLVIVILGYCINKRLNLHEKRQQKESDERKSKENYESELRRQKYEERKELDRLERKERVNELERRYTPHIEFKIDCQFFGPVNKQYLINLLLIADNRGLVMHKFKKIELRVRGIKKNEEFESWEGYEQRVKFPHKLFETSVIPPKWNFVFVEPGVAQQISYSSRVATEYAFLSVRAEFHYDHHTPHSIEGIFAVPSPTEV